MTPLFEICIHNQQQRVPGSIKLLCKLYVLMKHNEFWVYADSTLGILEGHWCKVDREMYRIFNCNGSSN